MALYDFFSSYEMDKLSREEGRKSIGIVLKFLSASKGGFGIHFQGWL